VDYSKSNLLQIRRERQ